jgi:hypothetical protein
MKLRFDNKLYTCFWYWLKPIMPVYTRLLIPVKPNACKRIFFLPLILLTGYFSHAQSIYPSTLNITGQFGIMQDFQFEISIGESTSITTMSKGSVVVTNGVLQTSVAYQPPLNTTSFLSKEINLYPNPSRDFVQVNFVSRTTGLNQYELFDMWGRKVISKQFYHFGIPRTEKLDISKLLTGTYTLNIRQYSSVTNEVMKTGTFKIVKIN